MNDIIFPTYKKRLFYMKRKSHKSSNIWFLSCFTNLCCLWFIWSDNVGCWSNTVQCSHVTKTNTYLVEKNQFYIECILILTTVLKKCTLGLGANLIDKSLIVAVFQLLHESLDLIQSNTNKIKMMNRCDNIWRTVLMFYNIATISLCLVLFMYLYWAHKMRSKIAASKS